VPVALPPAVFEDDVAAAEHLLRVPRVLVLVDGYNVTITARGGAALPDQRRWLIDATAEAAARTGAEFVVVFDGLADEGSAGDGPRRRGVQVRFTPAGVEADDEVLDLLAALPVDRPVVVVSDDHRVRGGGRRLGANVIGVDQLVAALRR
jgi:predicted RNA-binding protein with PIN domain